MKFYQKTKLKIKYAICILIGILFLLANNLKANEEPKNLDPAESINDLHGSDEENILFDTTMFILNAHYKYPLLPWHIYNYGINPTVLYLEQANLKEKLKGHSTYQKDLDNKKYFKIYLPIHIVPRGGFYFHQVSNEHIERWQNLIFATLYQYNIDHLEELKKTIDEFASTRIFSIHKLTQSFKKMKLAPHTQTKVFEALHKLMPDEVSKFQYSLLNEELKKIGLTSEQILEIIHLAQNELHHFLLLDAYQLLTHFYPGVHDLKTFKEHNLWEFTQDEMSYLLNQETSRLPFENGKFKKQYQRYIDQHRKFSQTLDIKSQKIQNYNLKIIDQKPEEGIFRGCVGNDCPTEKSALTSLLPLEHVFYIYRYNNKDTNENIGYALAYVQARFVKDQFGRNVFYIHGISGPDLKEEEVIGILQAFEKNKSKLGCDIIALPPINKLKNLINYPRINKILSHFSTENTKNTQRLTLYYPDQKIRKIVDNDLSSHNLRISNFETMNFHKYAFEINSELLQAQSLNTRFAVQKLDSKIKMEFSDDSLILAFMNSSIDNIQDAIISFSLVASKYQFTKLHDFRFHVVDQISNLTTAQFVEKFSKIFEEFEIPDTSPLLQNLILQTKDSKTPKVLEQLNLDTIFEELNKFNGHISLKTLEYYQTELLQDPRFSKYVAEFFDHMRFTNYEISKEYHILRNKSFMEFVLKSDFDFNQILNHKYFDDEGRQLEFPDYKILTESIQDFGIKKVLNKSITDYIFHEFKKEIESGKIINIDYFFSYMIFLEAKYIIGAEDQTEYLYQIIANGEFIPFKIGFKDGPKLVRPHTKEARWVAAEINKLTNKLRAKKLKELHRSSRENLTPNQVRCFDLLTAIEL